uniref:Uncharacterized protein n=1 Tax=Arundo donax TaxID=35708 RepID=A0A0A9DP37_ARUDO
MSFLIIPTLSHPSYLHSNVSIIICFRMPLDSISFISDFRNSVIFL